MSTSARARWGTAALIAVAIGIAVLMFWRSAPPSDYGLGPRLRIGPSLNGKLPAVAPRRTPGNWAAAVAFPKLAFSNPVGLTPVPGTNQLAVWEREGRLFTFENHEDAETRTLMVDVSPECQGWDDSGLLGVAFHPEYPAKPFVFLWYNWVAAGTLVGSPTERPAVLVPNRNRLSRFTIAPSGVAVPGSETVFIEQARQTLRHNGGGMFFHPGDGFLYLAIGDDFQPDTSQRIDDCLFSGILRLDVDARGGAVSHAPPRQPRAGTTAHYFIPNDNPFVGQAGVLEEFFAVGLRSPHRMTIDPVSKRIFLGDVGSSSREEIDLIEPGDPAGLNFQWNRLQGRQGDLVPPYPGTNRRPLLDYGRGDGSAVIGGVVYRGAKFASTLGGRYIFGDNVTGNVWYLNESAQPPTKVLLCVVPNGPGPASAANYAGLSSFGIDRSGELYMCQMSSPGGRILKLVATEAPPPQVEFPPLLSQCGVFADLKALAPIPGLIPYDVINPLWSDGADKRRWMAVPTWASQPGAIASVHFSPTGEWVFPPGTVFIKHFDLKVDERAGTTRRLETRLLVRDPGNGVFGATYRWRADNSDADLVQETATEALAVRGADGSERRQTWMYPSPGDCLACHTPASGGVLGVKTRQLNRDFAYPSGKNDNQLRALNNAGIFTTQLEESEIPNFSRLVATRDNPTASLADRARSYLDSNCAHCHRPGGVPAYFDARWDTPLVAQGLVNGTASGTYGTPGARLIAPGDLERSMLHRGLASSNPSLRMPPLASSVVDTAAVAVVEEWMRGLTVPDAIPRPWIDQDIGAVGEPGDARWVKDQFVVRGSGADVFGEQDSFHFVFQDLDGDGTITARVVGLEATDPWAKAGVMIREDLTPGSRHAFMLVSAERGTELIWRAAPNSGTDYTPPTPARAPVWVRLKRSGATLTGYGSADGKTWSETGTTELPMRKKVSIGLAVCAHNNRAKNTSIFEQVTVTRDR